MNIPPTPETAYYRTILEAAHWGGWLAVHFRPARTDKGWRTPVMGDGRGWPDWFMCHPRAGIRFVEVKRDGHKLKAEQADWGEALIRAGATWQVLSVPSELGGFVQELAEAGRR